MAVTPSQMLELGTNAPDFTLPDTTGRLVSLSQSVAKGYLVVFMCNHCPFVKHLAKALAELGRELDAQGLAMFGISSNDANAYPADNPANMAVEAKNQGYTFPYLYDESQTVAKDYRAACTPDFYLFNENRKLVYRGQFDDSRPGNGVPVTGGDLRAAITALLANRPISQQQKPSIGCNIKWRPGNEPSYFG